MLISDVDWEHQRQRLYQHFGLPLQASGYTPQLLANLEAGLTSLAEAVEAGEVSVDDQGVHLQALEAEEVPPDLEATKQALFKEVGVVQLPALLMAIDHETRFSWRLLGRAPTTDTGVTHRLCRATRPWDRARCGRCGLDDACAVGSGDCGGHASARR